jgi:dihydroxy-acid dehydratase
MITIDAIKGELSVALTMRSLRRARPTGKARARRSTPPARLWKYAQLVGDARWGAVTHPGGGAEKHVYADI